MEAIRKYVVLDMGGEYLLHVGEAADWDDVMGLVHAYLNQEGYDDSLYLDLVTSVEHEDHHRCQLTGDV